MDYLVAFDGSDRSEAALRRATTFADETGAAVLVLSVLPTDEALAETYDLLEDGTYDPQAAAERLRAAAEEVAPEARFRSERVDAYAGRGRIAGRIATVARETGSDVVFVGGDGGRVVRSLAGEDSNAGDFDLYVVRT